VSSGEFEGPDPVTVTKEAPALAVAALQKHFGGVRALDDVSLDLAPGEIRAVVGENGAGKSTLMRIIAGLEAPDGGTVHVCGVLLRPSPSAAREAGVALVHQELSLVPELSVAENICLGALPSLGGLVRHRGLRQQAQAMIDRVEPNIDVNELVSELSLAKRVFVEIAKALRHSPRVLVLDEPTAALTPAETNDLGNLIRRLAADGMSILFVSHRISEIFQFCQTATVLKDGRKVADLEISEAKPGQLVRLMVGRDLDSDTRPAGQHPGGVIFRVTDLEAARVHGASFSIREGEILGIGGLVGAGRTELVRAACRLDPIISGRCEVRIGDELIAIRSYRAAIKNGIALVPEDRHLEGLALTLSIADNAAVTSVHDLTSLGFIRRRKLREVGRTAISRFDIRAPSAGTPVERLSGGNQQKVALGKWLMQPLRVLILDEPTRGVDVGAKAQIHGLLREAAATGVGVLVVSSDLPELVSIADRVVVMRDGRIVGEVALEELSEEAVMSLATA
jgi:ABC-type sugar transport system ATPase subunit